MVTAVLGCSPAVDQGRVAALEQERTALQEQVRRLSYNTASGGGVNLKLMPDLATGQPSVPMEEVFTFDRNHAVCRVDTNRQAFKMPTYQMGEVVIEPNKFFMEMVATTVDEYTVTTLEDGSRSVTMRGGLSCKTEAGLVTMIIGSRTTSEHAVYTIEAVDKGIGGGAAGDSFAFTVFFDPVEAPINHSMFGPKFTFTGKMITGEITITDPGM